MKLSEDGLRLHIKNVQKDDQGIYQCFANNVRDQGYATAEFIVDGKFVIYLQTLYSKITNGNESQ